MTFLVPRGLASDGVASPTAERLGAGFPTGLLRLS